jgi:hypothetical protein
MRAGPVLYQDSATQTIRFRQVTKTKSLWGLCGLSIDESRVTPVNDAGRRERFRRFIDESESPEKLRFEPAKGSNMTRHQSFIIAAVVVVL